MGRPFRDVAAWLAATAGAAIALFLIAISNAAYETTSPGWLSFHVLLRKSYSVAAFTLVGYLLARTTHVAGRAWSPLSVALWVGAYSAIIEVGQRSFAGSKESLPQQAFDVACGLVGGALGGLLARMMRSG